MNHCLDRPALLFCACALAVLLGCAPPPIRHEYTMTPDSVTPAAGTPVLLIPVNQTEDIPGGLDVADHVLDELLARHLESKGLLVEQIGAVAYRRAAQIALERAQSNMLSGKGETLSGTIAYADVIPPLLAELESDAKLVFVSNIAMRSGEYTGGRMMRWDGVRRREKISANGTISGKGVPVASLHSMVFDTAGRQVFEAYGGLDAIFETNVREKRYDLKDDLLTNEEHLAEGVCVSFHPLFGIDERC